MPIPTAIHLKELHFYAYHGFHPEENVIGGRYLMDISVELDFDSEKDPGALGNTVNYEDLYQIAEKHMKESRKLLEEVVISVGQEIRGDYPGLRKVNVSLKKLDVPLGKHAGVAVVEMEF